MSRRLLIALLALLALALPGAAAAQPLALFSVSHQDRHPAGADGWWPGFRVVGEER
jgi:hypothetical protein